MVGIVGKHRSPVQNPRYRRRRGIGIPFVTYCSWGTLFILTLGTLGLHGTKMTNSSSTPINSISSRDDEEGKKTYGAIFWQSPPSRWNTTKDVGGGGCRYHGNCPVGSVCDGVNKKRHCQAYLDGKNGTSDVASDQRFRKCVQACYEELQWYEVYLYGSVPVSVNTVRALHGHGCVVEYQRIRRKVENKTISRDEWVNLRNHRLIRVDPHIVPKGRNSNDAVIYWRALCDDPCAANSDCRGGFICTSSDGKYKTCQASAKALDEHDAHDMIVVSGANKDFFYALENLAASLSYWAPRHSLVVYNLGMTEQQLQFVRSWSNLLDLKWPDGIPTSYPSHVRLNLKNYAWKPIVINETVHEYKSIFWLDAGATFVGPIEPIQSILHQHGIFLVHGQDDSMRGRSYNLTYQWFGYRKESFIGGPHYAGGIQGHVFPSRYIDTIVVPNAACALDESCIAPTGSHTGNHRYDQTTLSILAHQQHIRVPHHTEYLAGSRDQLQGNLSEPSSRYIIWTARGACEYYSDMTRLPPDRIQSKYDHSDTTSMLDD